MEKINIVILDAATLGSDIDLSMFKRFGNVTVFQMTDVCEIKERTEGADVVIVNKLPINEDTLDENVRLVCVTATGYDNIDVEFCRKKKIAICNVSGYSSDSVAQVTMAMALALVNHITVFDRFVKSGEYTRSGKQNRVEPAFHEMSTLTWGIIGLGAIGRRTAQLANSMGCRVLAYKRTPDDEFECVSLDELLSVSDIISIHLPLTEETHHLIGRTELKKMKKTAILINVARGAVVDEDAVANAIINGDIGGLGVDVYSCEPMSPNSPYNKLINYENVIFTPHSAWGAYESRIRCMEEIVKNIECFLDGGARNRVDL